MWLGAVGGAQVRGWHYVGAGEQVRSGGGCCVVRGRRRYAGVGEQVRSGGGGCVVRGRRRYAGYWAGDGMVGVGAPIARSGFSTTGGSIVAFIDRGAVPVCHC